MTTLMDPRRRSAFVFVEALRRHGSLSRGELARTTGLSRTTITSILDELERRGLVVEQRDAAGEPRPRGRPPTLVRLHPSAGVALGISIERDEMRVAVIDLSLTVLAGRSAEFELDTPAERLVEIALELVNAALLMRRVRAGDVGARRLLADAGRDIGSAPTAPCLALNPDAVIVGGELSGGGSPLLEGLAESLQRRALPVLFDAISVLPASLGRNAGALGGASLVVRSSVAHEHLVVRL